MADEISPIQNKNYKSIQLTTKSISISENEASALNETDFDLREKFDSLRSPQNIANQLQDAVDELIRRCPDVDWNENLLSYQVISAIRFVLSGYVFPNIRLHSNISKFDVEAYKLTGKAEQTHGDIAIVVTRSFPGTGHPISGVGFYEAKACSLDGPGYPAFSFQQLRRLVTNTPKLSYLLYDRTRQPADSQEWPTSKATENERFEKKLFYARTIDANFIKQYRSLDAAAYFMSQSFGYHFVQKILSGRELDYTRPPFQTIRRWLKLTRRTTAFVVSIAIQEDEEQTIPAKLQLPNFERLRFQKSNNNGYFELPSERYYLQEAKE